MDVLETNTVVLNLNAIALRVRKVQTDAQLDQHAFAERVGVPYSTCRAYMSGQRAPSAEFLVGCLQQFGTSPAWLLTGRDTGAGGDAIEKVRTQHMPDDEVVVISPLLPKPLKNRVEEPRSTYFVDPGVPVTRTWLKARNIDARDLRMLEVTGSSMAGVLNDGDRVLVNLGDITPVSGFAYVIQQRDELLVKNCQWLPDGRLRVSSANNNAYPAYDLDLGTNPDVSIVGRVVASIHDW